MNKQVKNYLESYHEKKGWSIPTDEAEFLETLMEWGEEVYSEKVVTKRHWDVIFKVVKLDDMLIGYHWARSTGDLIASEKGWEFDPDTICEVEEKTKTVTYYEPRTKDGETQGKENGG